MTIEPGLGTTRDLAWHALDGETCLAQLSTTSAGLSATEAAARGRRFGLNILPRAGRASRWRLLLKQFRSPLIYLLLLAAAVSLVVGDPTDAAFILAVLAIDAVIGALQEGRAAANADALHAYVRQTARVRRDGAVADIDASELVVGDIVLVETGAHIVADMRLLEANALRVDQSLLTGEAYPVEKFAEIVPASALVAERSDLLFAGTTAVWGRGIGVVFATGAHTELGRIGAALIRPATPLPLMRYLDRLSRQIALGLAVLIGLLGLAMALRGAGAGEIFMLAVALAVSGIPEGLPVAVTVALASATNRMAHRSVIVRTLPAVEGLGACTLIATDKTGTLTINRLSVEAVVLPSGRRVAREDLGAGRELRELARAAGLCNEAARSPAGTPVGDSVDVALLRFADTIQDLARPPARIALFAYEPANRFASVAVREGKGIAVYVKGAPETVQAMCRAQPSAAYSEAERLAAEGYRVLALARGWWASLDEIDLAHPHDLELLGHVGLLDPLRPEATSAVARCRAAGIDVRMITGDHPSTALTIATQLGFANVQDRDAVVTGAELAAMGQALAADRIARAKVFARIEPTQKLEIVVALQRAGHVVAVTGDGVNDAPALHAAQIGAAMGQGGTDVARDAADLILADDNFASIVAGVEEGRITFANLRKIVVFLLATGLAEVGMFLGAVLAGLPLPLTPVQLLWSNLVTEGVQDVMLGLGRGEGDELQRRPRGAGARLLDRRALALLVPPALVMAVVALGVLDTLLARGASLEEARSGVLLATVLFQNVFVLSIRSDRVPIWRQRVGSNPMLLAGVGGALVLHMTAITVAPLSTVLGTVVPDLATVGLCVAGALATLAALEAAKLALARRKPRRVGAPPLPEHSGTLRMAADRPSGDSQLHRSQRRAP